MKALIRRTYLDVSTGQLHLRAAGTGAAGGARPLLCFHRSCSSGVDFERFLAEMGQDRVVLAPDTPGCGMSDAPASMPAIGECARVMAELADAVGAEEIDVIGLHAGALLAAELALQYPDHVRHVVMVSAPIFTPEEIEQHRADWGPAVSEYDLAGTLPRLVAPVLILNTNDGLTVPTQRAAAHLANGRLLDLPEWGEGSFDARTEEVAELVRQFTAA